MSVHVLLDSTFFRTSVSIATQQRLLPIPSNRGLNVGDTVFLRDESGALSWVADVLYTGEMYGEQTWSDESAATPSRYAILGHLARIHPNILPLGKSRLQSPWVTLNSRTLDNALPWWRTHVLLYHSTLHLIEGLLTSAEVERGLKEQCLVQHPSGHIIVPHSEARKRLLVHVQNVPLQCSLCGGDIESIEKATQDHVIPLSQGGPDALANIKLTHRICNELKGNALPEQCPPLFPTPETHKWQPQFRNGRHIHHRRPRPQRPTAHQISVPLRGTGVGLTDSTETSVADDVDASSAKETTQKEHVTRSSSLSRQSERIRDKHTPAQRHVSSRARQQPERQQQGRSSSQQRNGVAEVDPAWLDRIQQCDWDALDNFTRQRNWAAKTASLRTLEQLPRSEYKDAQQEGKLIAEANGRKGTFQLVEWKDNIVLIEHKANRYNYFVVKRLQAISWDAYVWYLARFGRTTPLAVAMSLLPLWRQGKPDDDGRIRVMKAGTELELYLENDQLNVSECEQSTDVA